MFFNRECWFKKLGIAFKYLICYFSHNMPKMRLVLVMLLLLSACTPEHPTTLKPVCPDCNVVLVVIDTLRARDLGCYGYELNTSPFIDTLAKDAVVFENAFSQATITFASHFSMFTSTYPSCSGMKMMGRDVLPEYVLTMPQVLKQHNYTNLWAAIKGDPQLPIEAGLGWGFDYYFGRNWSVTEQWLRMHPNKKFFVFFHTYKVHAPYTPKLSTLQRLKELGAPINLSDSRMAYNESNVTIRLAYSVVTNKTFMRRYLSDKEYSAYLKLGLDNMSVKDALNGFLGFVNTTLANNTELFMKSRSIINYGRYNSFFGQYNLSNANDLQILRWLYDAEILEVDEMVSELVDMLKDIGAYNHTIIVITADHGEEFGEHRHYQHWFIHDETTHVPLIIRIPGIKPRRVAAKVENLDIMPTVLNAVGAQPPPTVQGKNLLPFLLNISQISDREVFSEQYDMASIRTSNWRFTYNGVGKRNILDEIVPEYELLRITQNDDSPQNLIGLNHEIASMLNRTLSNWVSRNLACATPTHSDWWLKVDNATKERILKTGYW